MIATSSFLPEFSHSSKMPEALQNPKDSKDPRNLVAQFLMGEVYLRLSNICDFSEMIRKVETGLSSELKWFGNVFSVIIDHGKCIVTNFEADLDKEFIHAVQMSHGEFLEVLTEWERYVATFNLPAH